MLGAGRSESCRMVCKAERTRVTFLVKSKYHHPNPERGQREKNRIIGHYLKSHRPGNIFVPCHWDYETDIPYEAVLNTKTYK